MEKNSFLIVCKHFIIVIINNKTFFEGKNSN